MKNIFFTSMLLMALLVSNSIIVQAGNNSSTNKTTTIKASKCKKKKKNKDKKDETKKVEWLTMEEAMKRAEKEPRRIIVDVYADWCGWCKKMDKTTFQHPDIAEYMNEKYYAVKLDAESKEVMTIAGKDYKYFKQGKRGAHELALTLLDGNMSLPSVVLLEPDLTKITIIPGYIDPPMMDQALHYFGEGFFDKGIKWPIFEKNYKSKIKTKAKAKPTTKTKSTTPTKAKPTKSSK